VNFVHALRDLWRTRTAVALIAVMALLAATAVMYRVTFPGKIESRRYQEGVATIRILVDTPSSQVVAVSPKGSETLGMRANLIASLMVDGVFKAAIAKRAGVAPNKLVGIAENDEAADTKPDGPLPKRGVDVLRTRVIQDIDGNQLPIIEIETHAADAAGAGRLANAAVEGLRDYLDTQAATEQVPDARRLRVNGLGTAQESDIARGPSLVVAFGIGIVVFFTGCGLLLGGVRLGRTWQMAETAEAPPLEFLDEDAWPPVSDIGPKERDAKPAGARLRPSKRPRVVADDDHPAASISP
jgi:hypothetical protein